MSNFLVWVMIGCLLKGLNAHLGDIGALIFGAVGIVSIIVDLLRFIRYIEED